MGLSAEVGLSIACLTHDLCFTFAKADLQMCVDLIL